MADLAKIRVKDDEAIRVDWLRLQEFIARCYVAVGVDPKAALEAAEVSVSADLRGVDTHGVSNAPRNNYVPGMKNGTINPRPDFRIVKETPNSAVVDGDNSLGFIAGRYGMNLAIKKAKERTVGVVTVRNSRHYGSAGFYAMMARKEGLLGISMTNAGPGVVPTFGREGRFGTNPIAVAVPAGNENYWMLDMATSTVAANKVALAARLGMPIPEGWVADKEGNPVTDPKTARESRLMLPLGGTPSGSSYKGYGLAVWVDIMCGVLAGGGFGMRMTPRHVGHFFAAINIADFIPLKEFEERMEQLLGDLKSTPPAAGYDRVYYAGEQEQAIETERRANGIPLHISVINEFRDMAQELGVTYDLTE